MTRQDASLRSSRQRIYLFTLRLWAQPTHGGFDEWRGELHSIDNGTRHPFQGLPSLIDALSGCLQQMDNIQNVADTDLEE